MSVLTPIANKIAPSCSGVDSSCDCTPVDCVLVEALINKLLVSMLILITNEITPSGSYIDTSRDSSHVDHVLVEALIN